MTCHPIHLHGGMTISAIPDMGKVVFTHGLTSTFRDGFIPLIKNVGRFKLAGEEVKMAGTALDMVLDTRAMAIADITGEFGRHSAFERGLQAASSRFGMVSLMAPWNAALKQFSGVLTMHNTLRAIGRLSTDTESADDIRKLAASGIDAGMAHRIWMQFTQHGDRGQDGDIWLAQAGSWTDRQAIEAFRAAVVRDVDRTIVTPGQDKPLWMSTELGKTVGQFRSFAMASMQKTFLAGLQQRDAATLNGVLVMMGLGAISYALKEWFADRDVSDDPKVWVVNAFDRSGIGGWIMDGNNLLEKATRGEYGFAAWTGEPVSRYQSRNVTGAFLGPTAGAVADIFQVSGSVFAGDVSKSDLRKARQFIPMNNLFYLRRLFDQVEKSAGDAMGLPGADR